MSIDATDVALETCSAAACFMIACGLSTALTSRLSPDDLVLFVIGALLPSKTGMKVGGLLGGLIAGSALPDTYRISTYWPAFVPDAFDWIGRHSHLAYGLLGAMIGLTIHQTLQPWTRFERFCADLVSAAAVGAAFYLFLEAFLIMLWIGKAGRYPAHYMFSVDALMVGVYSILFGLTVGVPLAVGAVPPRPREYR